ncbi:MAG: sialate O-acetylesterase [Bacteroidales bacterium]|nr:sialate O-acetylesterase [Bacteroidales bacterium]
MIYSFFILVFSLLTFFSGENSNRTKYFPKVEVKPDSVPDKENVWVFILAGQSNMAGRGLVEPQDTIPDSRIFSINKDGELIFAKEPLNFNEPNMAGLDCGLSFGKELLHHIPDNISILIINTAVGGSSISQWNNDSTFRDVTLLSNFKEKVETGKNYGIIKGILWHQGESDAVDDEDIEMYQSRLMTLFEKFREAAGNSFLPVLIGELGSFSQNNDKWQAINRQIYNYSKTDRNSLIISTKDFSHKGDKVHFDSEGQREMGKRFAEAFCRFSKVDTIESQILNYEDSKSVIISKGRKFLLDKFIEGDLNKVREIKDYLVKTEDENYIALYPAEYWFILYWTRDYTELAEDIQNFDSARIAGYNQRIRPLNDLLFDKLREKSFENELHIKKQIQESKEDLKIKQILNLNLEWMLLENRMDIFAQDSLNSQADSFLETYTSSEYEQFIRDYIRYKQVPAAWGFAFEFFSGYGFYSGELNKNYTNNIPIGIAFDICYRNFELYLRNYIGFNKTKTEFDYSLGILEAGERIMVFLPEVSIGYITYNDNRFKISPFAGIGSTDISPPVKVTEETPELKEIALEFTATYMLGINLDIKFGPKIVPEYSPKASYGFVRVRYGYTMPQFAKKYAGMAGNMHYITIGFGGLGRALKREY